MIFLSIKTRAVIQFLLVFIVIANFYLQAMEPELKKVPTLLNICIDAVITSFQKSVTASTLEDIHRIYFANNITPIDLTKHYILPSDICEKFKQYLDNFIMSKQALNEQANCAAIAHNGGYTAFGLEKGRLRIQKNYGQFTHAIITLSTQDDITTVTFSPDSKLIAAGSQRNVWIIEQMQKGGYRFEELPATATKSDKRLISIAIANNSKLIVAGFDDGTLVIWQSPKVGVSSKSWAGGICSLALADNNETIIAGIGCGALKSLDKDGAFKNSFIVAHHSPVWSIAICSGIPDCLISGSHDGTIYYWNSKDWTKEVIKDDDIEPVHRVAITQAGEQVASTANATGVVTVWTKERPGNPELFGYFADVNFWSKKMLIPPRINDTILALGFTPTNMVITASAKGTITIFTLASYLCALFLIAVNNSHNSAECDALLNIPLFNQLSPIEKERVKEAIKNAKELNDIT